MAAAKLLVERRGAVSLVTLNRPHVHNCVDAETADLLSEAIEGFRNDQEARVLVVTGAGERAFSSGADLKDIEAVMRRPSAPRNGPLGFTNLEPGKPRIAAVEGWCLAGAMELACWCDFAIAGEGAMFGALNRRWGVPWVDGGTQRMTRRIGMGNALYVIESGVPIDAGRALLMGLVQEVVPSGQALVRAMELAERIASYPQWSLLADRGSALKGFGLPLDQSLRLEARAVDGTNDLQEMRDGIRRFSEGQR
jgi:enoyl-CoA hydratase